MAVSATALEDTEWFELLRMHQFLKGVFIMARVHFAIVLVILFCQSAPVAPQSVSKTTQSSQSEFLIEPQLAKCTLQVGDQVLKPQHAISPWRTHQWIGQKRFALDKEKVLCWHGFDAKPIWSAAAPNKKSLALLADDGKVAYLQNFEDDDFFHPTGPVQVLRLDLVKGEWLTALPGAIGVPKDFEIESILRVLTSTEYVAVLTSFVKIAEKDRHHPSRSYAVACYRQGSTAPIWSKNIAAIGERSSPGAFLLGGHPAYASSDNQQLTWLGDSLLVCPEAVQAIYCFNPETGTELWKLERPWEFDRGFIGPSVWQHYISRFGIDRMYRDERLNKAVVAARKQFDEQFDCAIIGGPIVVPLKFRRDSDSHSFFLAVSKGRREAFSSYISDCVLYEFSDRGQPVAMVKLPQMVQGSHCVIRPDGVIWRCQNEGIVKAVPTPGLWSPCPGPGGPALLVHLPWFRQPMPSAPDGWLVAGRAIDPLVYGATHAFQLPAGGYIPREDKSVYRFPIAAIDLQSGVDQRLVLHVPFEGEIPLPARENQGERGNFPVRIPVRGPHILTITDLRADGDNLEVTLGMKNWIAMLRFDLGASGMVQTVRAKPSALDLARKRVKALGNVNARTGRGDTALIEACHDADSDYVRALLDAGADVNARTEYERTPLLAAAVYGSAEIFEMLIAAGAEVKAQGKNGWTVVHMAADGREAKRKLQALVKAGADLNVATKDGWDALMAAVHYPGNYSAIEYLLSQKISVSRQRKDGATALMMTADHGDATQLALLLKAGAEVNARDNLGLTPLMHAAAGRGTAESLRVLLNAGADLMLRNKNAMTALDLARKNEYENAAERVKALQEAETK